ncbi:GMC family oxidoreductase [Paenibacillus sambharensis]|uniref:GMC family oxidoreductase n=1 Tax=Paenibacillus sambharensis TaxID=1803190 RepID=A0A2W1LD53_9BACL|nr:GMC family oxidoreductase N-terminal domain-containing protein [Paenibacillus sambharensis]PZD96733.1 GMC family oxidoreductase [Paenibacillus sambharensis]
MRDPDVIVIGAGGGGAVMAKELGEAGLQVLVVEAGPWYGNSRWPEPNGERGGSSSGDPADLDISLLRSQYVKLENEMNDLITGRFRWGPADRGRAPWFRNVVQRGYIWQAAGVGGTTQTYLSNSPRAYPAAIGKDWPISYRELIPYYERVEATLPVAFAPTTAKEELFYYGASRAGWELIPTLNVTRPGFRPQPNAILPPNPKLMDPRYTLEELSRMEGCTLAGHCLNGCPHGPSVDKAAKRSTLVSYIPLALKTGNVQIMPNSYVMKVITERTGGLRTAGVIVRNTWSGELQEIRSRVVVMAAGCVESPRLWLNSGLPANSWVGKGLTNHCMDWVTGIFDEHVLARILGSGEINPFIGHTSGCRFDYPGLGTVQVSGQSPGLTSSMSYGISQSGYNPFLLDTAHGLPGVSQGRIAGAALQQLMISYRRSLSLVIFTDDEVDPRNGIAADPVNRDEHGPVPRVSYVPTARTMQKREQLIRIAIDILRQAGAREIIRINWPDALMIHMQSTMRMGHVVDMNGEAYQVKRLFIADNSMLCNGLGGANPTLTTQALAVRTAEKIQAGYFS